MHQIVSMLTRCLLLAQHCQCQIVEDFCTSQLMNDHGMCLFICAGRPAQSNALSRRAALALGSGACSAALLPRYVAAAGTSKDEKRGSQRGKGLFIIQNDFAFATGRYPPRVLELEQLPEQDANKDVYNAWGKCVQVFLPCPSAL